MYSNCFYDPKKSQAFNVVDLVFISIVDDSTAIPTPAHIRKLTEHFYKYTHIIEWLGRGMVEPGDEDARYIQNGHQPSACASDNKLHQELSSKTSHHRAATTAASLTCEVATATSVTCDLPGDRIHSSDLTVLPLLLHTLATCTLMSLDIGWAAARLSWLFLCVLGASSCRRLRCDLPNRHFLLPSYLHRLPRRHYFMIRRLRAELAATKEELGDSIHHYSDTRYCTFENSGSSIITKKTPLPQPAPPIKFDTAIPIPSSDSEDEAPSDCAEVLEGFEREMPRFLDIILSQESDPAIGQACPFCTHLGARRTTRCYDLLYIGSSTQPHALGEVWDEHQGFFVRKDISKLRPGGYALHLGHSSETCPMPDSDSDLFFIVVHVNGIHNTKIRFCHCPGAGDRVAQLLHHRLFPATLDRPETAFTFQLLHNFHLHHLESKATKYDYMGALRRLTDNTFTNEISDLYPQFRVVTQIWTILATTKRLGQAHGIDAVLPHRPPGNLIVYCPVCPEPRFNMLPNWEHTPPHFRYVICSCWSHLIQLQLTLDGNFHLNRYIKNTDPHDPHFSGDEPIFLKMKYNCGHLEVLRKQNTTKKFKNMAVTGKVSERFANTDAALAHALRQILCVESFEWNEQTIKAILDILISYDVSCAYSIHILERFLKTAQLSDVSDVIQAARWLIPLVHVQNHKDDCMYCFSSAYTPNAGHFHGETAEHFWPTGNQLGGQTHQMNAGHCHDTLIDHFGDWNYKKSVNLRTFDIKFNIFKSLSTQYSTLVPEWNLADRSWRHGDKDGVRSIYRYNQQKSLDLPAPVVNEKLALLSKSEVHFIHEGLLIRLAQLDVKAKVLFYKKENSDSLKMDIENARLHLRSRISKWRATQKHVLPRVGDLVADQSKSSCFATKPEEERLFLPSDLLESDQLSLVPLMLCECERQLLEGQAFDLLHALCTIVKTLTNQGNEKRQAYGQTLQTRTSTQIQDIIALRDAHINEYNSTWKALIDLGGISEDDPLLQPLTKQDTYMKWTNIKRQVGDTYHHDGLMWANRGPTGGTQPVHTAHSSSGLPVNASTIGTQGTKPQKRKHIAGKKKPQKKKRQKIDSKHSDCSGREETIRGKTKPEKGWLWQIRPSSRLTADELREWLEEGDRVQWYHTEAEVERWREEWEIKQVEFLRCIQSFEAYSSKWNELAGLHEGGKAAYATKTSARFRERAAHMQHLLVSAGYQHLLKMDGLDVIKHFDETRSSTEYTIPELQPGYVPHEAKPEDGSMVENSEYKEAENYQNIKTKIAAAVLNVRKLHGHCLMDVPNPLVKKDFYILRSARATDQDLETEANSEESLVSSPQ
ncbi:hypothetical protein CPB84DRAFT_1744604 [Gymnopilus junonius]|uniref:CxC2-like cysteine cluster KDZ transposase-associated domain-containing protein n=1 Tax=Gymnopilus junonius TaxID=109634 RepID=A0A9P5TQM5_GYMJU|nr:hypothetical protein CPB84DRAFT_1744604 [Gymnopilus junonius]